MCLCRRRGAAADIDPRAVECARRNLAVVGQAHLGDLYDGLIIAVQGRVDTLVVNAPYVPSDELDLMPSEVADQRYVGTAVTLQLAVGFTRTVATIWLVPVPVDAWCWRPAFLVLVPGPAVGIVAMQQLGGLMSSAPPEAAR